MDEEVYGGEIREDHNIADVAGADEDAAKELDEMKKRLKEMEEEVAALREMQAKVEPETAARQDPANAVATQANREEVDSRSVFLDPANAAATQANREEVDSRSVFVVVDYSCTPEEVQRHFQSCGTVNRVTILTNRTGQAKGYAYVEFLEIEAVQEALQLKESELHGRQIKVCVKRTNIPAMQQSRRRRFNPYTGYPIRRPRRYGPY